MFLLLGNNGYHGNSQFFNKLAIISHCYRMHNYNKLFLPNIFWWKYWRLLEVTVCVHYFILWFIYTLIYMWTTKSVAVTSILHGCLDHVSNISRAYHRNSKSAVIIAATVLGAPSTVELHVLLLLWDRVWRVTGVCFYYNQTSALPLDHIAIDLATRQITRFNN